MQQKKKLKKNNEKYLPRTPWNTEFRKFPFLQRPAKTYWAQTHLQTSILILCYSPWRRASNPLQYSCLENPVNRGAWWATVHGVPKSQTQLKPLNTHRDFVTLLCLGGLAVWGNEFYPRPKLEVFSQWLSLKVTHPSPAFSIFKMLLAPVLEIILFFCGTSDTLSLVWI